MKTFFLDSDFLTKSTNSPLPSLADDKEGLVLTIGNFDGLHLGHQAMLNKTIEMAHHKNLNSAVMVFEPMPKEFFAPQHAPARLMNRLETEYVFNHFYHIHQNQHQPIDLLIIADFNDKFRSLSAEDFAQLLKNKLNVQAVVLGDDFRFGHDRKGDSEFLVNYGFEVSSLNTVTDFYHKSERISSTRIRELLATGKLTEANQLLGRDYCMIGNVQHGDKIGRTLDFPTANVALDRLKPALHGIFAVDVQILDEAGQIVENPWQDLAIDNQFGIEGLEAHSLFGTANIGTRPAVNSLIDEPEWRLEVHFPKFKGNLYDKRLKVRMLHFLHGERNYAGLEELKAGIKNDVKELLLWRENAKFSNNP